MVVGSIYTSFFPAEHVCWSTAHNAKASPKSLWKLSLEGRRGAVVHRHISCISSSCPRMTDHRTHLQQVEQPISHICVASSHANAS